MKKQKQQRSQQKRRIGPRLKYGAGWVGLALAICKGDKSLLHSRFLA